MNSLLKSNAISALLFLLIPALLFAPMHNSLVSGAYTSWLKWFCILAPITLLIFGVQSAKGANEAKKYHYFFAVSIGFFIAAIAPSTGSDFLSSKTFLALVYSLVVLGLYALMEFSKYRLAGTGTNALLVDQALSATVPIVVFIVVYFYDSDYTAYSRVESHWFGYIGMGIAFALVDAVTDSIRKEYKGLDQSWGTASFNLANAFLWIFFSALFILN